MKNRTSNTISQTDCHREENAQQKKTCPQDYNDLVGQYIYIYLLFTFWLHNPGSNLCSLHWKCRVLNTGPSGKPQVGQYWLKIMLNNSREWSCRVCVLMTHTLQQSALLSRLGMIFSVPSLPSSHWLNSPLIQRPRLLPVLPPGSSSASSILAKPWALRLWCPLPS